MGRERETEENKEWEEKIMRVFVYVYLSKINSINNSNVMRRRVFRLFALLSRDAKAYSRAIDRFLHFHNADVTEEYKMMLIMHKLELKSYAIMSWIIALLFILIRFISLYTGKNTKF